MIEIVCKKQDNKILSISIDGHAGSGQPGEDLVCAAISSIAFGIANAMQHAPINVVAPTKGKMEFVAHENNEQANALLQTLFIQIQTVAASVGNEQFFKISIVDANQQIPEGN